VATLLMVPEIIAKIGVIEIVVNDLGILDDAMFLGREPLLSGWAVIPHFYSIQ
jgi:hypothetical protein